jgi:uncharacterized Zn finger protein (UPF0148 family)
MPKKKLTQLCPIHGTPLTTFEGKELCEKCLFNSHLTYETQRDAIERYNKSPEGRAAAKKYEQSEKGKKTRNKYLKSDKYKLARKAYNERLKQSLAIARAAQGVGQRAKATTAIETHVATTLEGLLAEIRDYIDTNLRPPSAKNVVETAKRDYNTVIDIKKAEEMIATALKSRK